MGALEIIFKILLILLMILGGLVIFGLACEGIHRIHLKLTGKSKVEYDFEERMRAAKRS